jgi:hypothetical protein
MKECMKCEAHGIRYRRSYEASEFLEGYADSPIWIVGLNPAAPPDWEDGRTIEQLQTTFYETARTIQYFRDFGRVSPWLFSLLGAPGGVAHTDLVKCSSKSWPPPGCTRKAAKTVVSNCTPFLQSQILKHKPRMIICNGSEVSSFIQSAIPAVEASARATSYSGFVNGINVWVVLSGFIGRIDNHARARLGQEIERIALAIGVRT